MRAIATSCAPGTADRRRLAWRRIGVVIINLALWALIILTVKAFR